MVYELLRTSTEAANSS
ncbi:unnamed protein product [Victoria cruziana]